MNNNQFYNTIDPTNLADFIVTWDTGKRCNFDCAYCGADRHDNFSPFPSFEKLIDGVDFLKEYLKLILPKRSLEVASISLTGGEPTANPNFLKFSEYLCENFKDFPYKIKTTLTTNGSYPNKNIDLIAKYFSGVRLSYHCDSHETIKEKVRQNIIDTNNAMKSFRVNLMMHPYDSYWDECIELINTMETHNVRFIPRVINGLEYSDEQSEWLKNFWSNTNSSSSKTKINITSKPKDVMSMATKEVYSGRHMKKDVAEVFEKVKNDRTKNKTITGRHCCNKVELNCDLNDNTSETITYLGDTNFENWYCSVNWFFLHLESQTDSIFHHQTCQAQYGHGKGPIGKISEYSKLIEEVKGYIDSGSMQTIKCPNKKCGCGLCATKSVDFVKFVGLTNRHVKNASYKYD